jgi:hypothetical protein
MSAPTTIEKDEWIGPAIAARMVGVTEKTMAKAAVAAGIRCRRLPGVRGVKYYRDDVLKLVRDCIEGGARPEPNSKQDQKNRTTRTRP